jgi:hypothetical protein
MALSADRNTVKRPALEFEYPVAASKKCYTGGIAVLDSSGNVEPGATATGKICVGRFTKTVDNSSGLAAALDAPVEYGTFKWVNSSSDPVTKANIGDTVYIEDDQTVSKTNGGATQSACGQMVDIESDGVWVKTEPQPQLGLLSANNLSDVGTVATARSNLGLDTGDAPTFLDLTITDDLGVGDDLAVTGLATVGETLAVTGIATLTAGLLPGPATKVLIKSKKTSLTAAEIKALATTAIECVAAVANKMLVPIAAAYKFTAGTEILVEPSAPDDIALRWVDNSGHIISEQVDAGVLIASAGPVDAYAYCLGVYQEGVLAEAVNVPIVVHNTGTDWTGNASNDCAMDVWILYAEVDVS